MFRTIINRVGNSGSRFAAFVTDEPFEDAPSILLKSKDDGKTDKQTGETGEDDPDFEQQGEQNENSAEIMIYDFIGKDFLGAGIGENDVAKALSDAGNNIKKIRVFINSPGGDSPVGETIYNLLTRHPAKVETVVDGLAASAASLVAMAGDKRVMRTGSKMMIHPASARTNGNAADHRTAASILDKFDKSIVDIFSESTGIGVKRIKDMVHADNGNGTWMTASEALDYGFVDEIQGRASFKRTSVDNQSFVQVNDIIWPANLFIEKEISTAPDMDPIKNSDDIKRQFPELHKEILKAGADQEFARIDELDKHLRPELSHIINAAKASDRKWIDIASECCDILSNALSDPNRSKPAEPKEMESGGAAEFRSSGAAQVVNNAIREGSDKVAADEKVRLAQAIAAREKEELEMIKNFRIESLNGFNGRS